MITPDQNKIWLPLALLLLIFTTACEKDVQTFPVSGKVYDPQLKTNVSGAKVVLRGSKIQYGIYNKSYVDLDNTTTASDGTFKFDVPYEIVSAYRFYIAKDDYFDQLIDVETEDIQTENGFNLNVNLIPIAYLHLKIKNTSPVNSDDEIRFRLTNVDVQCKNCWTSETIIGMGPTYDFDETAMLTGNKDIIISWTVKKNGQQHIYTDTIPTKAFQTVNYNINY